MSTKIATTISRSTASVRAAHHVLDFWFAGDKSENMVRHWKGLKETDDEIREKFLPTWEALSSKESAMATEWSAGSPRSVLALLIVWDQFSRALWRGDPRSFQNDSKAGKLSMATIQSGVHKSDDSLDDYQCHFFTMPLMHSEDLAVQHFNSNTFPSDDSKGHLTFAKDLDDFPSGTKFLVERALLKRSNIWRALRLRGVHTNVCSTTLYSEFYMYSGEGLDTYVCTYVCTVLLNKILFIKNNFITQVKTYMNTFDSSHS